MFSKIIKNVGIGRKLITYILLFSSLVTLLGTSLQLYLDYKHDIKSIQNTMSQIKSSYLQSISSNLWYINDKQVTILLDGILKLPHMQHLEIRQNGKQIFSVGQPQQSNIILQEFNLSFKFKGQDKKLGVLKATASLTGIYKQLWSRTTVILSTQAVKTFLVSAFILYIFYILVGRHLVFMADYNRRLDLKLLNTPLNLKRKPSSNRDELETLVESINIMRKNIAGEIAERKQAEVALKESEYYFSQIFKQSSMSMCLYNPDGTFNRVNDEFCKMFGVEAKKLITSGYNVFTNQAVIDTGVIPLLREIFDEKKNRKWEINFDIDTAATLSKISTSKPEKIYIEVFGYPILNNKGDLEYVVLQHHDISERKLAEKALKESVEKYRSLFEESNDGIIIHDLGGTILDTNTRVQEMLNYGREELNGMSIRMLHPDFEIETSRLALEQTQKDGHARFITKFIRKNGYLIDVSISSRIIDHKSGFVQGIVRDITDRKKLEAQLQQTQKMESIGTLAGGIAHDFNNILSSIIGFTELALGEAEKGTDLEDDLQEVHIAGLRAKDLVKQILTFARQSDESVKPMQVSIITKEVLKFIKSSIPTTIQINDEINSDSFIMGSPTQVHQILMNLCTNAAQSMEQNGGILEVSVNDTTIDMMAMIPDLKPGEYIEIKVADTGMGISPQNIHTIFEPYFTTKAVGEGTGMGLAVVHGIVENYGGQITVNSTIGKGTTFSIYLPITKKRKAHTPSEKEDLPLGNENILFVDDEAPIAKMGSKALEQLGYSVITRTSSVEALELFRSKPQAFDLVISDMTMPNMTGDKLAGELMKIRPDISVILCTGYSKKISEESAADIGIKALVYKPVVKADLAKTVRKVLDESKSVS